MKKSMYGISLFIFFKIFSCSSLMASYPQDTDSLLYNRKTKQRYSKAFCWWKKAAEQEQKNAQYNLGFMYSQGKGVARDYEQALYWWRKAATQGHRRAQDILKRREEMMCTIM